jgi:hypothetical protein
VDRRLVLGRDQRAPLRQPEAGGGRITVDGDDAQAARASRLEQSELRRART